MPGRNPFAPSADVRTFDPTSTTVQDAVQLPPARFSGIFGVPNGEDVSSQLAWTGAPEGTKSFAVTMYDPDAPTRSGFWHWVLAGIPASTTELPEGAGSPGAGLPDGAFHMANDADGKRFLGAAPPPGDIAHRYFISVFALGTDDASGYADASPAVFEFSVRKQMLARATIVPLGRVPGAA